MLNVSNCLLTKSSNGVDILLHRQINQLRMSDRNSKIKYKLLNKYYYEKLTQHSNSNWTPRSST